MITSLLSIAQGAATSAEFTVPAGVVDRVFLVDADGDGVPFRSEATVQRKGSGNQFQSEAWLDFWHPSAEIQGPGTFRVVRGDGVAVGVDRDNGTSSALLVGGDGLTLGGQALTAGQRALVQQGLGVFRGPSRQSLLTVAAGNSIAAQSKRRSDVNRWSVTGELQTANMFCGSAMRFGRITATTRADINGVYGYSGAQLGAINNDIEAEWFAPMHSAGLVPDLVIGLALLENDVSNDVTYAQMVLRLTRWLANVRRFPGVQVLLCTPRPSYSNNSTGRVAAFQAITDYMLSLDDGCSIFVTDLRGYEDPQNPGQPLPGYTDVTVHPNTKGAMLNARSIAETVNRIIGNAAQPYRLLSNNYGLIGSSAASGTGVSGTWPTGAGTAGGADGHILVLEAKNPGFGVTLTVESGQARGQPTVHTGAVLVSGGASTQVSAFAEIEIVSGAELLRYIQLEPRVMDGSGNNFQYHQVIETADADPDYRNGDVLTIRTPPMIAGSGTISQVMPYLRFGAKSAGGSTVTVSGSVTFLVRQTGAGLVVA